MTPEIAILAPVVVLVFWSMIMWTWMFATRIPAIMKAKMRPDPRIPRGEQMKQLPHRVRWKADNYNHLMEQPTVFYAVAIALAVMAEGSGTNLYLAWAYVIIRIIHSVFQSVINHIGYRFMLFVFSNIPLYWLAINAMLVVFNGSDV